MKEFAFDITLATIARVDAESETEAREELAYILNGVDLEVSIGNVRLTEASVDHSFPISLFETNPL